MSSTRSMNAVRGGVYKLYHSDTLTILNVLWGPQMTLMPHNHDMWAVIGVYCGREDNIFWRRLSEDADGRIEVAGAKSLAPGDVAPSGRTSSILSPTRLVL